MANSLYLHDSYITIFDFMNYDFAKLVLAWSVLQLGRFRRPLRPASEIRRPALFNPNLT